MRFKLLSFTVAIIFSTCKIEQPKEVICENVACTADFRIVTVKFVNNEGKPLIVSDFKAINQRTNQLMVNEYTTDTTYARGIYTIASDANLKNISETGDTILVWGTYLQKNTIKQTKFVVKGGPCACHVEKLSGPAEIVFE